MKVTIFKSSNPLKSENTAISQADIVVIVNNVMLVHYNINDTTNIYLTLFDGSTLKVENIYHFTIVELDSTEVYP